MRADESDESESGQGDHELPHRTSSLLGLPLHVRTIRAIRSGSVPLYFTMIYEIWGSIDGIGLSPEGDGGRDGSSTAPALPGLNPPIQDEEKDEEQERCEEECEPPRTTRGGLLDRSVGRIVAFRTGHASASAQSKNWSIFSLVVDTFGERRTPFSPSVRNGRRTTP